MHTTRTSTSGRRALPSASRTNLLLAAAGLAGVVVAGGLLWAFVGGEEEKAFTGVPSTDPGPIHVHGLGINPADGALFIATHTGLFRLAASERKAVRVEDRYQDTMGFSVVGADRFIGSGHPDARDAALPPLLGLIASEDAGRTWEPVSLLGDADFHVLRSAGQRVYGYDASNRRLLASVDRGRSWTERPAPGEVADLALDPRNPDRLVVSTEAGRRPGLYESRDGGRSWRWIQSTLGLLAWPASARLYLVDESGRVGVSGDAGRTFTTRGEIGGEPAALLGQDADELYAALHDGTIKHSTDGGATWTVRSRP